MSGMVGSTVLSCLRASRVPAVASTCRSLQAYRSESGATRQRLIANLGRIDKLEPKHLDPLINGLNRALGRAANPAKPVLYESSLAYGDLYALHQLWNELGFGDALKRHRPGRAL